MGLWTQGDRLRRLLSAAVAPYGIGIAADACARGQKGLDTDVEFSYSNLSQSRDLGG